jgi:hypothetical protein
LKKKVQSLDLFMTYPPLSSDLPPLVDRLKGASQQKKCRPTPLGRVTYPPRSTDLTPQVAWLDPPGRSTSPPSQHFRLWLTPFLVYLV